MVTRSSTRSSMWSEVAISARTSARAGVGSSATPPGPKSQARARCLAASRGSDAANAGESHGTRSSARSTARASGGAGRAPPPPSSQPAARSPSSTRPRVRAPARRGRTRRSVRPRPSPTARCGRGPGRGCATRCRAREPGPPEGSSSAATTSCRSSSRSRSESVTISWRRPRAFATAEAPSDSSYAPPRGSNRPVMARTSLRSHQAATPAESSPPERKSDTSPRISAASRAASANASRTWSRSRGRARRGLRRGRRGVVDGARPRTTRAPYGHAASDLGEAQARDERGAAPRAPPGGHRARRGRASASLPRRRAAARWSSRTRSRRARDARAHGGASPRRRCGGSPPACGGRAARTRTSRRRAPRAGPPARGRRARRAASDGRARRAAARCPTSPGPRRRPRRGGGPRSVAGGREQLAVVGQHEAAVLRAQRLVALVAALDGEARGGDAHLPLEEHAGPVGAASGHEGQQRRDLLASDRASCRPHHADESAHASGPPRPTAGVRSRARRGRRRPPPPCRTDSRRRASRRPVERAHVPGRGLEREAGDEAGEARDAQEALGEQDRAVGGHVDDDASSGAGAPRTRPRDARGRGGRGARAPPTARPRPLRAGPGASRRSRPRPPYGCAAGRARCAREHRGVEVDEHGPPHVVGVGLRDPAVLAPHVGDDAGAQAAHAGGHERAPARLDRADDPRRRAHGSPAMSCVALSAALRAGSTGRRPRVRRGGRRTGGGRRADGGEHDTGRAGTPPGVTVASPGRAGLPAARRARSGGDRAGGTGRGWPRMARTTRILLRPSLRVESVLGTSTRRAPSRRSSPRISAVAGNPSLRKTSARTRSPR